MIVGNWNREWSVLGFCFPFLTPSFHWSDRLSTGSGRWKVLSASNISFHFWLAWIEAPFPTTLKLRILRRIASFGLWPSFAITTSPVDQPMLCWRFDGETPLKPVCVCSHSHSFSSHPYPMPIGGGALKSQPKIKKTNEWTLEKAPIPVPGSSANSCLGGDG